MIHVEAHLDVHLVQAVSINNVLHFRVIDVSIRRFSRNEILWDVGGLILHTPGSMPVLSGDSLSRTERMINEVDHVGDVNRYEDGMYEEKAIPRNIAGCESSALNETHLPLSIREIVHQCSRKNISNMRLEGMVDRLGLSILLQVLTPDKMANMLPDHKRDSIELLKRFQVALEE